MVRYISFYIYVYGYANVVMSFGVFVNSTGPKQENII